MPASRWCCARHIAAFFGECFGGRSADTLRCASDQYALAAQMKIHRVCPSNESCCAKKMIAFRAISLRLAGWGAIPGTVTWLEYPSSPISFDAPATPAS
jgi:hypothetical protein